MLKRHIKVCLNWRMTTHWQPYCGMKSNYHTSIVGVHKWKLGFLHALAVGIGPDNPFLPP